VREVRVIDEVGGQIGILPIDQALAMARSKELDLVEVSPDATPPVCRVMDFGRFRYQQKKKTHQSRSHMVQLKEIRLHLKTGANDIAVKATHAREFLEKRHKILVNMVFRGREESRAELGREILNAFAEGLSDIGKLESEPKKEGRRLWLTMTHK
jgi:translation initiation factor IF-3